MPLFTRTKPNTWSALPAGERPLDGSNKSMGLLSSAVGGTPGWENTVSCFIYVIIVLISFLYVFLKATVVTEMPNVTPPG